MGSPARLHRCTYSCSGHDGYRGKSFVISKEITRCLIVLGATERAIDRFGGIHQCRVVLSSAVSGLGWESAMPPLPPQTEPSFGSGGPLRVSGPGP